MVFFNALILVLTKGHTYLNLEVVVEGLLGYIISFVTRCSFNLTVLLKFLRNNQTKSEASHQLCFLKKLF